MQLNLNQRKNVKNSLKRAQVPALWRDALCDMAGFFCLDGIALCEQKAQRFKAP
jgi:hypothetical protein